LRRNLGNDDGCHEFYQNVTLTCRLPHFDFGINALSIEPPPMRTESLSWWPGGQIDLANDAEVRAYAARLCVTPGELLEIIEELGDRAAYGAAEAGYSVPMPGDQDRHGGRPVGPAE
jgi:hypothetical protein